MNRLESDPLEAVISKKYEQKFGREFKMPSVETIKTFANAIPECFFCGNFGKPLTCGHTVCEDEECQQKHSELHG